MSTPEAAAGEQGGGPARWRNIVAKLSSLTKRADWFGPTILVVSALVSIGVSLLFGFVYEQRPLPIDTSQFDVLAGLVVGALAIERLTELLIAPWVPSITGRSNRVAVIGAAAIVLGVVVAGGLGLRLLDALTSDPLGDGSGFENGLVRSADILLTGLAIGGGTKPLHDLLSRLGHGVEKAKNKDDAGVRVVEGDLATDADAQTPIALRIRPTRQAVPLSGAGRAARKSALHGLPRANLPASPQRLVDELRAVFPAAMVPSIGPGIPDELTISLPTRYRHGSDSFVREAFSHAHNGVAAGLQATPELNMPAAVPDTSNTPDPDPTVLPRRWALEQMRIDSDLIERANGGRGVRVAHLDTGYRRHPLAPAWELDGAWDFLDGDADPEEPDASATSRPLDLDLDADLMRATFHGTGTGSVIGGPGAGVLYSPSWWSDSGAIGVAPEASVVPVRVMRGPVHMFDDDVAAAVRHAHEGGSAVISMALGGYGFVGLDTAIAAAVEAGVIVVAAAGNQVNSVVDPAAFPNVIAVANSTRAGVPNTEESSSGPAVDVTAPGTMVWRAGFDDSGAAIAKVGTGTSYSVSQVAGVAALWLSLHGRDRLVDAYGAANVPRLFAHLVRSTAKPWTDEWRDRGWGSGIVDARALLDTVVLDGDGGAVIDTSEIEGALDGEMPESGINRIAATVASVFTGEATTAIREKIVRAVGGFVAGRQGIESPFATDESDIGEPGVPPLVAAEFRYGLARDPRFGEPDVLEVKASPQLNQVMSELAPRDTATWGSGLSLPLRRLLTGARPARITMRWVGFAAIAVATVVAFLWGWQRDTEALGIVGRLSVLGVGIYAGAQAIERFLELAVGPFVFKDRPDRREERALIMLGAGVLIGTLVSLVTGVFLLESLATGTALDTSGAEAGVRTLSSGEGSSSLLRSFDVLVTGLVIGGGAKPIHDLIERIQLTAERAKGS